MRNLIHMVGRSLSLFHLPKLGVFPNKNFVTTLPVGSPWVSPRYIGTIKVVGIFKQLATHASPDEEAVPDETWNQILAAIENGRSLRSSRKICVTYIKDQCNAGNLSTAVRLLQLLRNKNIFLGPIAYNFVLAAAGEKNDVDMLSEVFKDLVLSCEFLPSASYFILVKAFTKINDHVPLLQLVKEVSELTFPKSTTNINRVIFAFAECGQFDKALLIFDHMKDLKCKPDLITYNTILDLLGHAGRVDEMLHEFASMKEAGIAPDFISYNTLLNQLRKVGRLDLCLVYFREMGETGIKPDLLTYTALIESFGRSGNIEESLRLLNEMKARQIRPSIYIYRSIINSLKKMGKVNLAMDFLEEMNASLSNLAGSKDFKQKGRKRTAQNSNFLGF